MSAPQPQTPAALAEQNASLPLTPRELAERMRVARVTGDGIPEVVRVALQQRKNQHLIVATMAEMNWGKGLDEMTRRAVAKYLEVNKLDLTEIDVLGGNLYRNSRYYKRRLGEMVEDGMVEYAKADWVHTDNRLKDLLAVGGPDSDWALDEFSRRLRLRVEYGIPDAATGACIYRIKLRGVDREFTAAKWCGGGTQKKNGRGGQTFDGDPIGDLFPIETSESRACRRAMTFCASSIPALRWREEDLEEQGVEVSSMIREGLLASGAVEVQQAHPTPLPAHPEGLDVYGTAGAPVVSDMTREESLALDLKLAQES